MKNTDQKGFRKVSKPVTLTTTKGLVETISSNQTDFAKKTKQQCSQKASYCSWFRIPPPPSQHGYGLSHDLQGYQMLQLM